MKNSNDIPNKRLAVTDLEMTGLDPARHEIVELAVIIADQKTLEILETYETKIRPEHIGVADPESLAIAGYKEEEWIDAISLKEALEKYSELMQNCVFAAWNTPFDWGFLQQAFIKTGIENPMDYHTIDLWTSVYEKLKDKGDVPKFSLSAICKYLGIEKEPMPHRAINGATKAYEIYKKIKEL